jgi:peptidyl-prolyl cis-trans isomerase SurA
MKSILLSSLLVLTTVGASAQRGPEVQEDRIVATANGTGITLSDIRRQIDPNMGQLRAGAKNDAEFKKAIINAEEEVLNSIAERLLVIAEFRATNSVLPASYIDANIEETIRRDFNGDRNRFVASLRAAGTTPLAHRKRIEDRIIFDYMVSQVRRDAWDVNPGKILEYYEKNKSDFVRKEQAKLSQITITQGAAEKPEETALRSPESPSPARPPSPTSPCA